MMHGQQNVKNCIFFGPSALSNKML